MLDQLKSRFNTQMSNFKTKWSKQDREVARMNRYANQEYKEVQRMKASKSSQSQPRQSIKDQVMSDNGVIEEYTFTLPLKAQINKNTLLTGSTHCSSLDEDDDKINIARINNRIQIHSLKSQRNNQSYLQINSNDIKISQK